MTEPEPNKPKIIVDEGWKAKVEAEKKSLQGSEDQPADRTNPAAHADVAQTAIPEASFSLLLTTLATQALVSLGQLAAPDQEEVVVNLDFAKHCIDTLEILEYKTKGNLTPDETALISGLLYELRMTYVAVSRQTQKVEP